MRVHKKFFQKKRGRAEVEAEGPRPSGKAIEADVVELLPDLVRHRAEITGLGMDEQEFPAGLEHPLGLLAGIAPLEPPHRLTIRIDEMRLDQTQILHPLGTLDEAPVEHHLEEVAQDALAHQAVPHHMAIARLAGEEGHEIIGSGRLVDPAHPLEGTEQQGEMPVGQPLATDEDIECRLEILLTLRSSLPLGRLGRLRGGSGIGRSRLRSLRRGIRLVEMRTGHDNDATVDRTEKLLGVRVV